MPKRKIAQGRINGRQKLLLLGLLMASLQISGVPSPAQTRDQNSPDRKLITRVEPDYPDTLKRLYIGGVVRVSVRVAPNGVVKSTELLGGNPILGQATMKAIKQWRYAPTTEEEVVTVKLEFDPHR